MTEQELEKLQWEEEREYDNLYWKHYKILEDQFMKTLNYVELHEKNFPTFSVVFAQLLISIGSEVDNVLQKFCNLIDGSKVDTYSQYVKKIKEFNFELNQSEVWCKFNFINYTPWIDWEEKEVVHEEKRMGTFWWRNYQAVKHFRAETDKDGIPNYTKANLKTVFYALMGLYSINIYCQFLINDKYEKSYQAIDKEGYFNPNFGYESNIFHMH